MKTRIFLIAAAAVAALTLSACDDSPYAQTATQNTAAEGQSATDNQATLVAKEPIPKLNDSIERANLIERANFLNNHTFQSCIYLFTQNGALVGYYPVKRKPSSLNSYLLPGDKVVDSGALLGWYSKYDSQVVEQSDIDGAYGKNADGIFFFAQDTGEYIEWQGDYLYTSNCSKPSQQPMLVRNIPAN